MIEQWRLIAQDSPSSLWFCAPVALVVVAILAVAGLVKLVDRVERRRDERYRHKWNERQKARRR